MIVEDDPANREVMGFVLEKYDNYILEFAEDGEEGLQKYIMNKPDIIITDYVMPKMNGGALINEIRKIDKNAQIILLTGYRTNNGIPVSDVPIINKPFEPKVLIETIESVLSKSP
ncbi:MAG: response regulator [Candidatus Woesearchaeota archaeon]